MSRHNHISIPTFLLIFGLLIAIGGCENKAEKEAIRQAMIKQGVAIKVSDKKNELILDCRQKALDRAVFIVDSLIAAQAFFVKQDTIQKPDRVVKPLRPALDDIPDTIEVAPILGKN